MHDLLLHHEGHNAIAAGPSAVGAVAGAIALLLNGVDDAAGIFTAIGIAAVVVTGIVTVRLAVPVNNRIRARLEAGDTEDYPAAQDEWRRAQLMRASAGPAGFVAMAVAAVVA
jgi:hypothetical protein